MQGAQHGRSLAAHNQNLIMHQVSSGAHTTRSCGSKQRSPWRHTLLAAPPSCRHGPQRIQAKSAQEQHPAEDTQPERIERPPKQPQGVPATPYTLTTLLSDFNDCLEVQQVRLVAAS
jgi:hypothetical protein